MGLEADPELTALALQAVDRVLAEDSEWRELWDEAGSLDEATGALEPVRSALRTEAGPAV